MMSYKCPVLTINKIIDIDLYFTAEFCITIQPEKNGVMSEDEK